jgi:hypothetical protein
MDPLLTLPVSLASLDTAFFYDTTHLFYTARPFDAALSFGTVRFSKEVASVLTAEAWAAEEWALALKLHITG